MPGYAVVAGEDEYLHAIEPRRRSALPAREPGDQLLQPAKAARWLGELKFAAHYSRGRTRLPAGKSRQAARRADKEVNVVIA